MVVNSSQAECGERARMGRAPGQLAVNRLGDGGDDNKTTEDERRNSRKAWRSGLTEDNSSNAGKDDDRTEDYDAAASAAHCGSIRTAVP